MKNSKRAHRILAWLLTMTLIFTMSFSSIAYAAETDTAGETKGNTTEATTENTSEEAKADPAEETTKATQEAEEEETQNSELLGEGTNEGSTESKTSMPVKGELEGDYYLTEDTSLSGTVTVPNGKEATIIGNNTAKIALSGTSVIEVKGKLTIQDVIIEANNSPGWGAICVTNDSSNLTIESSSITQNCIPKDTGYATSCQIIQVANTAGTTGNDGLQNISINISNSKLNAATAKTGARGICFCDATSGSVTLNNTRLYCNSGDFKSSYTRGFSTYQDNSDKELIINITNNSEVKGFAYPVLNGGGIGSKGHIVLNANDSIFSGWCCAELYGNNNTLNYTDCKIEGKNLFQGNSSNDYSLFQMSYGSQGSNNKVNLNGCTLTAASKDDSTAKQKIANIEDGTSIINFRNGTEIVQQDSRPAMFTAWNEKGADERNSKQFTFDDTVKISGDNCYFKFIDAPYKSAIVCEKPDARVYNGNTGIFTYAPSLKSAIDSVNDGGTISLIGNVTLTEDDCDGTHKNCVAINNGKKFTLDLNKNTLNGRINLRHGDVTFKNGKIIAKQALNVYGSEKKDEANYSVLNVEKDVTLDADYGVSVFPKTNENKLGYGVVVDYKADYAGTGNAVFVSGNLGNSKETATALKNSENIATINIYGKIESSDDQALALNGMAKVNIMEGSEVVGPTAIGAKRGILNVDGGTITAVGDRVDPAQANNSGTEDTGAAISITSTYNYAGDITVNVNNGVIESVNNAALYLGHSVKKSGESIAFENGVSINVNGGKWKAPEEPGTIYIAKEIEGDGENAIPSKFVSSGYYSSAFPDNCIAANKALIPSDKDGYKYMVGAKRSDVVVSTPAEGENTIEVPATGVDNNEVIETLENIDVDLDAAARTLASEQGVTKEDAKKALKEAKIDVPENAEVVVQVETFLKISVEQYPKKNNDKYVLDIKPMYQLVAKTKVSGKEKTAVIGEAAPLEISNEIEVAIPIPEGFLIGNPDTITIKHTKDDGKVYYYSAKVVTKADKTFAVFKNPNGFSEFQLMQQSDNVNIDTVKLNYTEGSEAKSIDTTIEADKLEYTAKFKAVKNAPDVVKVKVASTGTDDNAKVKVLLGGIESKENNVDLGLGTTTFNVLVLAEDDTAVLYTFNVTRCELVDNAALSKTAFTYNGRVQTPAVTVKTAAGTTLKNGDAYTVSYKGNRLSVGTHTVNVVCKGSYEGDISKTYTINPAKPAIKKIKSSKRKMKVYMTTKPGSKGAKYYRIYYKQKGSSTWKSTTTTSSSKTIKGLKKGKRYYVKAYAYTGSYKSAYSSTKLSKKIR